jgi:hypothetical protein
MVVVLAQVMVQTVTEMLEDLVVAVWLELLLPVGLVIRRLQHQAKETMAEQHKALLILLVLAVVEQVQQVEIILAQLQVQVVLGLHHLFQG